MNKPRLALAAALLAATMPLSACALVPPPESPPGTVQTADGPVDDPSIEGEPDEPPEPVTVPNFHEKYAYKDGVEIEITKIDRGRITREQAENEFEDNVKAGVGWVRLTCRIRNGSKKALDANLVYATVTYGADGREAVKVYFNDDSDFEGKILPGRAKTAEGTYQIPEKYWGDVVLEMAINDEFDRESVVFQGSVK